MTYNFTPESVKRGSLASIKKRCKNTKFFDKRRWIARLAEHNRIMQEQRTPPLGTPLQERIRAKGDKL